MKKFFVALVLIGASAFYIFTRSSDTAVPLASTTGNTNTNGITITPVQQTATAPTTQTPSPTPTKTKPVPTASPKPTPAPTPTASGYKDGTFTGSVADAYYGLVQVKATILNGAITDVTFLSYPNDRSTSRFINGQATPILAQEAIQAQNANVDIVSGATDTSLAFRQSLSSALAQAQG